MSAKQLKAQAKKWGDKEKELLLQAIHKHGIGSWALIKSEFLPQWVRVNYFLLHLLVTGPFARAQGLC